MKKIKLNLDKYELGLIINALVELRNCMITQSKDHDFIDELLLKLCK